jgi:hypothetical protein
MTRSLTLTAALVFSSFAFAEEVEPTKLFDGESLKGWTYHLDNPDVKMEEVWSVEDGILKCKGKPSGYLNTEESYENYKLVVEWRWSGSGGNNGVLVHCTEKGALGVWPKSLEVQLGSGDAGDFWVIGTTIKLPEDQTIGAERIRGRRHLNLTDGTEKELGEWNQMEIVCDGDKVTVKVNDTLVNECHSVSQTKGQIALQSEGTPIEFRKVELTPLEKK